MQASKFALPQHQNVGTAQSVSFALQVAPWNRNETFNHGSMQNVLLLKWGQLNNTAILPLDLSTLVYDLIHG